MIRLGTKIWYRGRTAMVVARTLAGNPTYDIRFADGGVVKYVPASDFEVVASEATAA